MKIMNHLVEKNENAIGKVNIKTPKNIRIDEFNCLTSEAYLFKSGDDIKSILKGVSKSQTKHIKFGEY